MQLPVLAGDEVSGFTSAHVRAAAIKASAAMEELKPVLNDADARMGDGDTGSMLSRVLGSLAEAAQKDESGTVGEACLALAKTAASSTGSSLGTLLATALMSIGKATREKAEVEWSSLSALVTEAQEKMAARGGAKLGDKTVLDGLQAIADEIKSSTDRQSVAENARIGAQKALDAFRDQPNKIGRARMFADATVGHDDPGMLALARLVDAISRD